MGGLRKTTSQVIGNLGAAYVPITNYQTEPFDPTFGLIVDQLAGTIAFTRAGNYQVSVNFEASYTPDNNSSRNTHVRMFNITLGQPILNGDSNLYAGAYTAGFFNSATINAVIVSAFVGNTMRLEVGGGSNFAAFTVLQVMFTALSVGPV